MAGRAQAGLLLLPGVAAGGPRAAGLRSGDRAAHGAVLRRFGAVDGGDSLRGAQMRRGGGGDSGRVQEDTARADAGAEGGTGGSPGRGKMVTTLGVWLGGEEGRCTALIEGGGGDGVVASLPSAFVRIRQVGGYSEPIQKLGMMCIVFKGIQEE